MTEYEDDDVTVYTSMVGFFAAELSPIIERRIGPPRGIAWCSQWSEHHPEAIVRITAVWEAWETLHGTGKTWRSTWLLDHVDPHLAILFDGEAGPFYRCADGHVGHCQPLPVSP